MIDEEVEDVGEEEGAEEEGEPSAIAAGGAFMGSLKGILTAVTGLVVAIGGLITVLANSGVIGGGGSEEGSDGGSGQEIPGEPPVEPDNAAADAATPDAAPNDADETRMFVVVSISDGWAAVRSQPTIGSAMVSRLETGDFIRCGRTMPDAGDIPNRNWRYCPEVEGHIAATLLRRVRN